MSWNGEDMMGRGNVENGDDDGENGWKECDTSYTSYELEERPALKGVVEPVKSDGQLARVDRYIYCSWLLRRVEPGRVVIIV